MINRIMKLGWLTVFSRMYTFIGLAMLILFVPLGIMHKDILMLLICGGIGLFFTTIGLTMKIIFKQGVYVGISMFFGIVSLFLLIAGIITLVKTGIIVVLILGIIFLIAVGVILVSAKSKNKLNLYHKAETLQHLPVSDVIRSVVSDLYNPEEPWSIHTDGNSIIAEVNWKDTTRFAPGSITKEVEDFKYKVNLFNDYTYTESMESSSGSTNINITGASVDSSAFYGVPLQDSFTVEFGVNNKTGEQGLIMTRFSTDEIRDKIRKYVEERGYRAK